MPIVQIYTDGSVWPSNPGFGGWAAVLVLGERIRALHDYVNKATNNSMESTAVLKGLAALKIPCDVEVCTDSMYVINGLNALKRGKMLKTNTGVWTAIRPLVQKHNVTTCKIKGHSGDLFNSLADYLARQSSEHMKRGDTYIDPTSETYERFAKKAERRREKAA